MLLFNTYLAFLVLALATWLITIVVELRGAPSNPDAEEVVVTD
jgi:thiol:disulfide interchange protein